MNNVVKLYNGYCCHESQSIFNLHALNRINCPLVVFGF